MRAVIIAAPLPAGLTGYQRMRVRQVVQDFGSRLAARPGAKVEKRKPEAERSAAR